jgi:FKBP-type peptidyl-prolyl cis-trans isomerase SlyD
MSNTNGAEPPLAGSGAAFQIGPGMWVRLRYGARDADGEAVEDLEPELGYVHGYGALLPRLESALDGHRVGELVRVTLPPREAFGERREEAVLELARDEFPEEVAAGDRFEVESEEGALLVLRVLEVAPDAVVVDANHPLAGQAVTFQLEVLEVRPATDEESSRAEDALDDDEPAEGPLLSPASLLRGGSRRYEQSPRAAGVDNDPEDPSDPK